MAATNLIEKLTAIADAVREKTETTDALTLDAMAEAIAALETGGGYTTGTFTLSEDTAVADLTFEHGLGKVPKGLCIGLNTENNAASVSIGTFRVISTIAYTVESSARIRLVHIVQGANDTVMLYAGIIDEADGKIDANTVFALHESSGYCSYLAGKPYRWIVFS